MVSTTLQNVLANLDISLYTFLATIVIAIIGWIFALWLQAHNTKQQHKIQIQYDIYKQFIELRKEIQDTLSKLGASSAVTPFVLMDSSMIPFTLKLQKQYKDIWIEHSEGECLMEGEKKWENYVQDLKKLYSEFSNKYLSLVYLCEDWASAIANLLPLRDILFKEISILQDKIYQQSDVLSMYAVKNGHDWRKWDRTELQALADSIRDNTYDITYYLGDFMVLVHNELMAKYFNHYRATRKTLDPRYKVLTMRGVIENLDHKKISQMKIYKERLSILASEKLTKDSTDNLMTPEYKIILKSIINGICPTCKNPIDVVDMKENENKFHFDYICGHGWNELESEVK